MSSAASKAASKEMVQEIIRRQVEAMASPVFEVGLLLMGADADKPTMLLRKWNSETLYKSIGWLQHENAKGRNIYIRPHGEHSLSLLDDLSLEKIAAMKEQGFTPSLVVETSPGNFQAWVNHGMPLAPEMSTAAAKALAEKFGGDPSSADWRHFGRLSAFTNRKDKYCDETGLFPFVKLIEAEGHVYKQAGPFLSQVHRRLRERRMEQERQPGQARGQAGGPGLKTIEDFRARPEYGGDQHRIDLAYATYALSRGAGEHEVRSVIESRDLSKKGNEARQHEYVDRTLKKAARKQIPLER